MAQSESQMMRSDAARSRGEEPTALVDPDLKSESTGVSDEIGIAVAIDIGENESDDLIVGVQPLPPARGRDPDRELARRPVQHDVIANAVAIEIGTQAVRLRDARKQKRRDTAERCNDQPPSGRDWLVDDAASQGSCDLNRPL